MNHSSAIPSACGHRVCYVSTGHNLMLFWHKRLRRISGKCADVFARRQRRRGLEILSRTRSDGLPGRSLCCSAHVACNRGARIRRVPPSARTRCVLQLERPFSSLLGHVSCIVGTAANGWPPLRRAAQCLAYDTRCSAPMPRETPRQKFRRPPTGSHHCHDKQGNSRLDVRDHPQCCMRVSQHQVHGDVGL